MYGRNDVTLDVCSILPMINNPEKKANGFQGVFVPPKHALDHVVVIGYPRGTFDYVWLKRRAHCSNSTGAKRKYTVFPVLSFSHVATGKYFVVV